jgi:hypothetical protein
MLQRSKNQGMSTAKAASERRRLKTVRRKVMTQRALAPGVALRRLRERADLTLTEAAKLLQYASPSGLQTLERGATGKGVWKKVPSKRITLAKAAYVGRGKPPITVEEVEAVNGSVSPQAGFLGVEGPDGSVLLTIRYEVTPGVLIRPSMTREPESSQIGSDNTVPVGKQFAAVLGATIPSVGAKGTQLHIFDPSLFPPEQLRGRRVLYAVREGRVMELTIERYRADMPLDDILGVVVAAYMRE